MDRASSAALLLFVAGCSMGSPKPGLLEKEVSTPRIHSNQLRLWVHEAALDAADRIEEAADQIAAATEDEQIRRHALMWKINAIQACFRAASRHDALGAFADLWILGAQMSEFFDTGAGRELFGSQQGVAVTTARAIEARLERTFASVFRPDGSDEGFRKARQVVDSFAKAHPIESLYFRREPMSGPPESRVAPESEGFGVVADLEADVVELQRILSTQLEYLPRIARWQSELLLMDERGTVVGTMERTGRRLIDHFIRMFGVLGAALCVAVLGGALLLNRRRLKAAGPAPPPAL